MGFNSAFKGLNIKYSTTILVNMYYIVPARRHIPEGSRGNSVPVRTQTSYSIDSRFGWKLSRLFPY